MPAAVRLTSPRSATPLVDPVRFLQATRETGYRNTATAVAELIDNSLQAAATRVEVRVAHGPDNHGMVVGVADNGRGLTRAALATALQFGGSTRFGDRRGAGRFGMGLPNASISQARRIDFYSWSTARDVLHAFLDFDDVLEGRAIGIESPKITIPPTWLEAYGFSNGTAVLWSRCDRLQFRKVSSLVAFFKEELGRVFRAALATGIAIRINGEPLAPVDPLRVAPGPAAGRVKLLPLLALKVASTALPAVGTVTVQFSELPVETWAHLSVKEKRSFRIVNWAGVSVLRAGREISYGWHFLGGKRRENYDDWWRCEIAFDPSLDEYFGVTHSKQGIRPTQALLDVLTPTIEAQARRLSRNVRRRFEEMRQSDSPARRKAESRSARLLTPASAMSQDPHARGRSSRGVRYRLRFEDSPDRAFLRANESKSTVSVIVNRLHPFYTQLYGPLTSESRIARDRIDSLLFALGRSLVHHRDNEAAAAVAEFFAEWSDVASLFLET